MSTLFDTYYDSLGHELNLGSTVCCKTSKGFIYGHIVEFTKDNKSNFCYKVIPDIGYPKNIKPKKFYKVRDINTFLIIVKKKK